MRNPEVLCLSTGSRTGWLARTFLVAALSTDEASSPNNLYGATKIAADKLFVAANTYTQMQETRLAVVRYGYVMGSRGSVVPFFQQKMAAGVPLPINDERRTRFWIRLPKAVQCVVDPFDLMAGGELDVPRIPSMKLVGFVEVISPDYSHRTFRQDDRYVVTPTLAEWGFTTVDGDAAPVGFTYRSNTNDLWLKPIELRAILGIG